MQFNIHQIYLLIIIVLASCQTYSEKKKDKIYVVTTTGMLYDAVINIGKDKIYADAIMGPGVDPHLYKASIGDLKKIRASDIVVYNGLFLEGKMSKILKKLGKEKAVLAAGDSIPKENLINSTVYKNSYDPHIWFDINNWKYAVKAINHILQKKDTVNASFYSKNTENYLNKLTELHLYIHNRIKEIPKSKRILVTSHDAFSYFGKAYNIRVEGLQGVSTVSDIGLKDIANMIDLIIENEIKSVFTETSVSKKSINALIVGCREKGYNLKLGGKLYSDAMGNFGTQEGTYIGMFTKNIDIITEALK